ncbi:hypothetical protein Cri9333_3181 [Crinalium epipsammum PCC 9333]|uniref:DUF429 domain-containing protein n=1 Tax=Crinalium epipsammum PCC 9333 TaxID=1173022 RepID=K9W3K8_9CYAN|nr:DUF429 domain-containing protein [Crinalium epipsammum]AFZ14015.1 hypothetical protein Cri9333_3181 [Crinalium epipsammum PCC 9333]
MKFIGIDFGWVSGASGLCCLEWRNNQLEILNLDRQQSNADILSWLESWISPDAPGIIAVDAPTLIPNATGMRLPDKLSHKHFGKYHAGCYPASLARSYAQKTVQFGLELELRGFVHAPIIEPQKLERYQIEVYPHAAMVNLFNLERILKYKKGKLAERQIELKKLCHYILKILPNYQPRLDISSYSLASLCFLDSLSSEFPSTGATLKALEDKLDALICAYIAAYWWYWGIERNLVLGNLESGYIVVPQQF